MPAHGAGNSSRMGPPPIPEHLGGMPPSSIAAIVQTLSKASGSPQLSGRDDFQQLLAEILGPNDSESSDAGALEENIALNYRLLQIVTTAGLSVLLQDDPFAVQGELISQAIHSLLVIRKAINRNPQVLFCPPPIGNDLKETEQTYLFLWLLPRLLPLLGRSGDDILRDDLLKTLQCIFIATTRIPEAWKYIADLISYCRSCFMSIVGTFRSPATYSAVVSKSFRLALPGNEFAVQHDTVLNFVQSNTKILKFTVSSLASAGHIAINIYSTLSNLSSLSYLPGIKAASDTSSFMIHGVSALWDSISAWESLPPLQNAINPLRVRILEVLCTSVEDMGSVDSRSLNLASTAMLGLKCQMSILHAQAEMIPQSMEPVLASFILTLLKVAESNGTISYMLKRQLYPIANNLVEHVQSWGVLSPDFQMAIMALVSTYAHDPKAVERNNQALRTASGGKWIFKNTTLQTKADRLGLVAVSSDVGADGTGGRPHKRPKLTASESSMKSIGEEIDVPGMISETYMLLGSQEAPDLAGLNMVASNGFKKLNKSERYIPFRNLGLLSCAVSGTLKSREINSLRNDHWGPYYCTYCDSIEVQSPASRRVTDAQNSHELFTTFENMVKLDEFRESSQARIWAMMSLRRLLNHTEEAKFLNIETFTLGQWCMQSLHSSMRELRIAASRTLPAFLSVPHDEELLKANCWTVIAFLKSLSETEDHILQETCVVAWGHVGRMLQDQELNIALISLVKFLGNSNSFIVGVAYNEIQALAVAHKETPRRLFTPFWRSISPSVVKQLQTRPQIAQLLSELCGLEVSDFLVLTQTHTLPYLVLSRKSEIIERIAQANGNTTVRALCVAKPNMTAILAVLLTQDIENIEVTAISLLTTVSPEFGKISFEELIRSDPILLAEELIKMAGDENEAKNDAKKNRIIDALRLVSTSTPKRSGAAKKEKKIDPLGVFFENNVLGIMAQFSDTIHDVRGRSTPIEKIRCLRGIGEMTKLVKGCVSSALPQIFACLQSAMKHDMLRKYAFSAWAYVMCELPEEDIIPLVGQTFAILLQYWEQLHDETKEQVREMVVTLFERYPKQLEENVSNLPSLGPIALLAKQEFKLRTWKDKRQTRERFMDFAMRCCNENGAVVEQTLIELSTYLQEEQSFIHISAASEQPDKAISQVMRSLLDACVQYKDTEPSISRLAAECLGMIGAVDPSRVEATRASQQIIVLHNFEVADESLTFVINLLEQRLVKAFLAATDTKAQGFLAYAMQELLKFCDFDANVVLNRRSTQAPISRRWRDFSETARSILTPYLTSKYVLSGNPPTALAPSYPIYTPNHNYRSWLQTFLFDLLAKVRGDNATSIFAICSRIIKGQDIAIPSFILPYITLNVVIGGTDEDRKHISQELLAIVEQSEDPRDPLASEILRECSETVFLLVDYLSKWLKEKKQYNSNLRLQAARSANRHVRPEDDDVDDIAISRVEKVLSVIPPDIMGIRSFECKSYSRALFYWEQHIRQSRKRLNSEQMKPLYEKLQHIYAQIDEPDGIEGISAHLKIYTIDQQIIEHKNAGRWTAAQSWYELELSKSPNDPELQVNLLTCLKESGQYDNLIHRAEGILSSATYQPKRIIEIAVEASWLSENWEYLDMFLQKSQNPKDSYDIDLGRALSALRSHDAAAFKSAIMSCRQDIIKELSHSGTGTLGQCHTSSLKLHVLSEIEQINNAAERNIFNDPQQKESLMTRLQRRLDIVGASARDREYILAIRRTAYRLINTDSVKHELGLAWLATARLARKGGRVQQAFSAILQSSKLGEPGALVEHARLLWHEGQHRKAIQSLQGVIDANILHPTASGGVPVPDPESFTNDRRRNAALVPQNLPLAKANLLLAKWLDTAGHLNHQEKTLQYQKASNTYLRWEQGYYYLGRHYNNLYEAHKNLPPAQQPQVFLNGETAKLVCSNYLRSLPWGTKYIFQTLPRFLTLWLDLGEPPKFVPEHGSEHFRNDVSNTREKNLAGLHNSLLPKYMDKIQPYMWYTVLPQIISRICHPHNVVHQHLEEIITKVVSAHPQQALWSLMAVTKSTQKDRSSRGSRILGLITNAHAKAIKMERKSPATKSSDRADIRVMITQAQRLTEQLLQISNADLPGKSAVISLKNDLRFNHSVAPCPLVLPVQAVLSVTLPANPAMIRSHMPFGHEQPTIYSFSDEADVMSSLQKPRKITITASNGRMYNFLCKPKDDLRKDARLMEFAAMINRLLKKDPEAIQRRLHIRTYHVTPLNEECGLIEWVPNVRPFRDILFKQYKKRGITVNFNEARQIMNEACSAPQHHHIFTDTLLPKYPPVLHEWFVDHFPDPAMWLSSRTAYARTSAVWSMVGNVLGLGDRHGENILLDETNGDTAHVDFNCLFDKGLTFDKPEMVPFRLTNNMVDGFGVTGYEGPFRRSSEVVVRILRSNEDTLMTVLEAFLYDPAVDMVVRKQPKKIAGVVAKAPDTPREVLEGIRTKIRGRFPGESKALSVEGQVHELIRQAVSPDNLCKMYIGWMSFF